MKKYKLFGEILSPLHIGTGSEIEFFDYIIKKNRFYKIVMDDFLLNLGEAEKSSLLTLINQNNLLKIREFMISNWNPQRFPYGYSCAVSDEVSKIYEKNINNIENQLLINPFIRTGDKMQPYIPGSSLKGAIRTALINALGKNMKIEDLKKIEGIVLDCLNNEGKFLMARDPFRAIKIKDTYLTSDKIIISKIVNVKKNRRGSFEQRGIQIFAEVTYSALSGRQVNFETEIAIDTDLLNKNLIKRKIDINLIKNACNSFYQDKLKDELENFFQNTSVEKFFYSLLSNLKFNNHTFILRVGRYSGLESVTLDNYRKPRRSSSRNLCEMKYPFGWIKLDYQEV